MSFTPPALPRLAGPLASLGRSLGHGLAAAAAPLVPAAAPVVTGLVDQVAERVDGWARGSQQAARRNAMVAATVLAARRAEIVEVDEFLADKQRERDAAAPQRRASSV